ncbi:hypothetical protein [Neobacillus sp. LXY-1]|uniref:hypothetical protein n=1 Tax=Neobacillus sp. LXY-1 TaxID=3379133 RepID=UPI003EE376E4
MNRKWGILFGTVLIILATYSVIFHNNNVSKYGLFFIGCINTVIGVKQLKQKDQKNGPPSIFIGISSIVLSVLS